MRTGRPSLLNIRAGRSATNLIVTHGETAILCRNVLGNGGDIHIRAGGNEGALVIDVVISERLMLTVIRKGNTITEPGIDAIPSGFGQLNIIAGAPHESITISMKTQFGTSGLLTNNARIGDKLNIKVIRHDSRNESTGRGRFP